MEEVKRLAKNQKDLLEYVKLSDDNFKNLEQVNPVIKLKSLAEYCIKHPKRIGEIKLAKNLLKNADIIELLVTYPNNISYVRNIDLEDFIVHPSYFCFIDDAVLLDTAVYNQYIEKYPEYAADIQDYRDTYEERKLSVYLSMLPYKVRQETLVEVIERLHYEFKYKDEDIRISNISKQWRTIDLLPRDKNILLDMLKAYPYTFYPILLEFDKELALSEEAYKLMLGTEVNSSTRLLHTKFITASLYNLYDERWKILQMCFKSDKIYELIKEHSESEAIRLYCEKNNTDNNEIYEIVPNNIILKNIGKADKIKLYEDLLKLEPKIIEKFDTVSIEKYIHTIKDIRRLSPEFTKKHIKNYSHLDFFKGIEEYLNDDIKNKIMLSKKKSARK